MSGDKIGRWLKCVNQALLACFLLAMTLLVSRAGILVGHVAATFDAMATDLKSVSATAGQISRDIENVRDELTALGSAKSLAGALVPEAGALSSESEQEINQLFYALANSNLRFEDDGELHSITTLYFRVYTKYTVMRKTLSSAEDFIANVATQSMWGRGEYIVVDKDGARHRLCDWLTDELKKIRAAQQDAPKFPAEVQPPEPVGQPDAP